MRGALWTPEILSKSSQNRPKSVLERLGRPLFVTLVARERLGRPRRQIRIDSEPLKKPPKEISVDFHDFGRPQGGGIQGDWLPLRGR